MRKHIFQGSISTALRMAFNHRAKIYAIDLDSTLESIKAERLSQSEVLADTVLYSVGTRTYELNKNEGKEFSENFQIDKKKWVTGTLRNSSGCCALGYWAHHRGVSLNSMDTKLSLEKLSLRAKRKLDDSPLFEIWGLGRAVTSINDYFAPEEQPTEVTPEFAAWLQDLRQELLIRAFAKAGVGLSFKE